MKTNIFILFFLVLILVSDYFWNQQFQLNKIGVLPFVQPSYEYKKDFAQLKSIVDQPFRYLDRGKQSFVFKSEDNKYVLKFFDISSLKKTFWMTGLTSLQRKQTRLTEGYLLAYLHCPEDSGLIYLQLQPNETERLPITLIDRLGFHHNIDLDKFPFVLQLKAIPTREYLSQCLRQGDSESAKAHLRNIIDLYLKGYQNGIYDQDSNIMYNTGYLNGNALRLDVGRLTKDESMKDPAIFKKNIKKIVENRCGKWLKRYFPSYYEEIISDLRTKINQEAGTPGIP